MRFKPPSAGSHRYQRYSRTGDLKTVGIAALINRPQKFDTWLTVPLHTAAGRFRRLAREFIKKPLRAERLMVRVKAATEALGDA